MTATYTSLADEEFFGAIGRLTISWAHLELGLDGMVHILYHGFGGKAIDPEIPQTLSRKIRFLRAAFKKLPIGDEGINGYLSFLDRVEAAAVTRHDIIHGIVVDQAEGSGEATIVRIARKRGVVSTRRFTASTTDILRAAAEAQRLGGKILSGVDEIHSFIEQQAANKKSDVDLE